MQKLYCYVDESGQDTQGLIFVVSIVILEDDRTLVMERLDDIEAISKKRNVKWHRSRPEWRKQYMDGILQTPRLFRDKIFFESFTNTKQYLEMTSFATAKALICKARGTEYSTSIYVDGLRQQEVPEFSKGLRTLNIKRRKVRGVRREENNAFVRLADATCGLIRDANDGQEWAGYTLERLMKKGIVTAL